MTPDPTRDLSDAAHTGNLPKLRELLRDGVSPNFIDPMTGDTFLATVVMNLCNDDLPCRYAIVRELLVHGANPNTCLNEDFGPLSPAILAMDVEMIRLLLESGTHPNPPPVDGESLYDFAEFDYRYETYDLDLPEDPSPADTATRVSAPHKPAPPRFNTLPPRASHRRLQSLLADQTAQSSEDPASPPLAHNAPPPPPFLMKMIPKPPPRADLRLLKNCKRIHLVGVLIPSQRLPQGALSRMPRFSLVKARPEAPPVNVPPLPLIS